MTINENRQHNLRLLISRITNETLSKIFCNLRNGCIGSAPWESGHGVECLKGWIGVTYVCHTWREVAVNTSSLWCHIDILPQFRSWIPELLRRSKQSPLTIAVVQWIPHGRDLLVEVKERVRELVLERTQLDTARQILASQSDFQNLEALNLSGLGNLFVLNDSHIHTESFRRLTLDYCAMDWNSKFLQGLTHLSLQDIPYGCTLGCHEFTLILSKIPALETLHLAQFLHEEEQVQTHQATKVDVRLQHLQRLSVDCEVPEMAQFLPCLVVPPSCDLHLSIGRAAIDDEFRAVLSWVSNHLLVSTTSLPTSDASDHGRCIRSFHLQYNPDHHIVEGFCDLLSQEQLMGAPSPDFQFVVRQSASDYDDSFDMQHLLTLLPLGAVTFLEVFADEDICLDPGFWTVAFGSLHLLTTVHLETITSGFWEALTLANGDGNRTVRSLPFPALSSITVKDRFLDSQLMVDKLRVRSVLGGTQLQDLRFSSPGVVPPAPFMIQLGELGLTNPSH
jgi:hypothetical protein